MGRGATRARKRRRLAFMPRDSMAARSARRGSRGELREKGAEARIGLQARQVGVAFELPAGQPAGAGDLGQAREGVVFAARKRVGAGEVVEQGRSVRPQVHGFLQVLGRLGGFAGVQQGLAEGSLDCRPVLAQLDGSPENIDSLAGFSLARQREAQQTQRFVVVRRGGERISR